jgi:hypothetical protein
MKECQEPFMKRHIATALIAGIGLAAPTTFSSADLPEALHPASRHDKNTLCRLSQFGHLRSAGRFRRNEIAKIFVDEGMVFAEWSGQVHAPQPRRIETEEIDAEWMAHCHADRWLLSRRELLASHELPHSLAPVRGGEGGGEGAKLWSVQVYGNHHDAAGLQIIATASDVSGDGSEAFTVNYEQSNQSAKLSVRGHHNGRIIRAGTAAAASLADLRQTFPMVVASYLEPALARMMC